MSDARHLGSDGTQRLAPEILVIAIFGDMTSEVIAKAILALTDGDLGRKPEGPAQAGIAELLRAWSGHEIARTDGWQDRNRKTSRTGGDDETGAGPPPLPISSAHGLARCPALGVGVSSRDGCAGVHLPGLRSHRADGSGRGPVPRPSGTWRSPEHPAAPEERLRCMRSHRYHRAGGPLTPSDPPRPRPQRRRRPSPTQ